MLTIGSKNLDSIMLAPTVYCGIPFGGDSNIA